MRYVKIYDDGEPEQETETKDNEPLSIMPKMFATEKLFCEYQVKRAIEERQLERAIGYDHTLSMLYKMGLDTSEKQYPVRLDIVQKWWGVWGSYAFKLGYEKRGNK